MNGFVLDASAILAYLEDENGKDLVAPAHQSKMDVEEIPYRDFQATPHCKPPHS
jgi:hypothetical protein